MKDFKSLIGKKVLVTTSAWFYAPDGHEYRSVHGTLLAVCEAKEVLGFAPSRQHANWFLCIGKVTITGCQVNYLVECETVHSGSVNDYTKHTGSYVQFERPTEIYVTD